MGEGHAYGRSLGCISRRAFVLGASSVMFALCCVQLVRWVLDFHLWDAILGNTVRVEAMQGCVGTQCYEVLSCFGMRDATLHVREPLTTFAGLALLPWAMTGAQHMSHDQLRAAGAFFMATAAFHLGLMIADVAYLQSCAAYPGNMIHQTMINWMPPSPVTNGAQSALRAMAAYPVPDVAAATDGFRVFEWYLAVAGALVAFLVYTARETHSLGDLAERGPLGLGMHFGFGQWDEILDHDAIRRIKRREVRSAFLEDARLPDPSDDAEAAPLFRAAGQGYGAAAPVQFLPATHADDGDSEPEDAEAWPGPEDAAPAWDDQAAAAAAAAAAEAPPPPLSGAYGRDFPSY